MSLILKSQANDVLATIRQTGLDPREFAWGERTSPIQIPPPGKISFLTHQPTGYFFRFDITSDGEHYATYSPGADRAQEERQAGPWHNQLIVVAQWLKHLKREIDAPDLWASLGNEAVALRGMALSDTDPNDSFSPPELARIAASLAELRSYMEATYDLTASQSEDLSRRLDYLLGAASRLGRKDWLNLALGVLINIAIAAAFAPDAARGLLQFAVAVFRWLSSHVPPLP